MVQFQKKQQQKSIVLNPQIRLQANKNRKKDDFQAKKFSQSLQPNE